MSSDKSILECTICGELAKPWHDLRRDETGWCCKSENCIGGGRTTRYTREWLREQFGKHLKVSGKAYVTGCIIISLGTILAVAIRALIITVRTPDPVVGCAPDIDVFDLAKRIGCTFVGTGGGNSDAGFKP